MAERDLEAWLQAFAADHPDATEGVLASLSHAFAEPLRRILHYERSFRGEHEALLPPPMRQALREVDHELRQMSAIVDGARRVALALSEPLVRGSVDLDALVAQVLDDLGELVQRTGAVISVAPLPRVTADWAQLAGALRAAVLASVRLAAPERRTVQIAPGSPAAGRWSVVCAGPLGDGVWQPGLDFLAARLVARRHGGDLHVERAAGRARVVLSGALG